MKDKPTHLPRGLTADLLVVLPRDTKHSAKPEWMCFQNESDIMRWLGAIQALQNEVAAHQLIQQKTHH
jgi:hypothetical protein